MNATIRTAVQTLADEHGYGSYSTQIDEIANLVETGASDSTIGSRLTAFGAPFGTADTLVRTLRERLAEPEPTEPTEQVVEGFDRQGAADIIREMLTNPVGRDQEYDADEISALLILAGLEDEPVVEPEPEVSEPESFPSEGDGVAAVAARIEQTLTSLTEKINGLVAFARRNGYDG